MPYAERHYSATNKGTVHEDTTQVKSNDGEGHRSRWGHTNTGTAGRGIEPRRRMLKIFNPELKRLRWCMLSTAWLLSV